MSEVTDIVWKENQVKNEFNKLKRQYKAYQLVKSCSGGGVKQRLESQAWKELVESHPDCKEFETAEFEFYGALQNMFQGKLATGKICRIIC